MSLEVTGIPSYNWYSFGGQVIAPAFMHMTGDVYLAGSIILGLAFLYFGVQVVLDKTYTRARQLLLASVVYLPALFTLLILDRP